ncbi:TetR/AcrR family transcriptional regulator [Marinobacterium jannaschii]|uniref:TetR/AcrR family transcriptional regulator n=1 Tax=Marinobacterium jannaschii TaxID=64970 RepID=UPI0004848511|nr:TetR/AcrR family transcriptional regulator [Marinobacterium jannaschii]
MSKRDQLISAAMALLVEQGNMAFSMNALARHASASKETLYRHFGNKQGLFEAIVSANADQAGLLQDFVADNPANPEGFLLQFGETLLRFLMSPGSIVINRIVIAEAASTPELAAILESHGRQRVAQAVSEQFASYHQQGLISETAATSLNIFIGLLLQDSQIKVLDGSINPLGPADIADRAKEAARCYMKLFKD